MARPSFATTVRAIAANDWRIELRRMDALIAAFVFTLVVMLVFHLALDEVPSGIRAGAFPGLVWVALAFAVVVGMARSFESERQHGLLDTWLASPADRSALFCGKLVANYLRWCVLAALVTPLTALMFPAPLAGAWPLLLAALLIFGIGLSALGTLFAAILMRLGRGEAFFATLLLPAASPLLMGGIRVTQQAIGASAGLGAIPAERWLAAGAGLSAFYFFAGLLLFEFVVEG